MKKNINIYCLSNNATYSEEIELACYCPCCGVRLAPTVLFAALVDGYDEEDGKVYL